MFDHWNECVESILGMLEDTLLRHDKARPIPTKQASRKPSRCTIYSAPLWKRSISGNQSHKRKRQFGVDMRDRKIIRTSNTGSSTLLRGTTRSFDNLPASMTTPSPLHSSNETPLLQLPAMQKQEQVNLPSSTKCRLDQWLMLQIQPTNIPSLLDATAAGRDPDSNHFYSKQLVHEITNTANRLLSTCKTEKHDYIMNLKGDLVQFSALIRKWLGLDANNRIQMLFPDWKSLEDRVYGMMCYIKGHEVMHQFDSIPRTEDLLYDIHYLQSILDDGVDYIGTELCTNGATWKEMGLWVDQDMLNATKQQLSNLCIGLQHELSSELSKLGCTEKMMECVVCGLELMASATELTGCTLELGHNDFCKPLVILYAQWTNNELQHTTRQSRTDLRRLQLLNNMTRALSAFYSLVQKNRLILSDTKSMDSLASLLVDITINVVSKIDQLLLNQNQSYIQRSNIMRNTFLPILYLEQSLVAFADVIVTLSDQNLPSQTKRIKWLYSLLE